MLLILPVLSAHTTFLLQFLTLLPLLRLGYSLRLALGVVANHHHRHQRTANLAKQSRATENHIGGSNQGSDAPAGDIARG